MPDTSSFRAVFFRFFMAELVKWTDYAYFLFGNVNVVHPVYGYGRRATLEAPLRQRNKRITMEPKELHDVVGFNPPSLILQDELHLIEGPLGSMVGAYEMAVDILSDNGIKPKYIASSATIKEASSQVGTIFRRRHSDVPASGNRLV